jgi:hypothetical protein
LVVWRDKLFLKVQESVMRMAISLIQRERDNDQVDTAEIRLLSQSFGKKKHTHE